MNHEVALLAYIGLAFVAPFYGIALTVAWRRREQFWQTAATAPVALWIAFGAPMLLSYS